MSSQPRLDFEGYIATRIENARVRGPLGASVCLREGCGQARPSGAKPGLYCSAICRRADSHRRAKERRDQGKSVAAANHSEHLETARRLALQLLAEKGTGTISDLREYAAELGVDLPWHLPWTGSVFLPHRKGEGWFEATGERENVRHLKGNWRKVNVYRLTEQGRREWQTNPQSAATRRSETEYSSTIA